jgi:hypothetical protein
MTLEPREVAAVESYPTFWDEAPPHSPAVTDPVDDAYAAFVNLTEDELPADPGSEPDDGD